LLRYLLILLVILCIQKGYNMGSYEDMVSSLTERLGEPTKTETGVEHRGTIGQLLGKTKPNANMNNMAQPVNNVSELNSPNDFNQMANLWGEHYQTTQDSAKMAKFQEEMGAPENAMLMDLAQQGASAFGESETGMNPEDFANLLYHTGFHESNAISGNPQLAQMGGGPGSSYFQVEPSTLRDVVTATQSSGETNPTTQYWGPKAAQLTGYRAEDLYSMDDAQLMELLRNPENQGLGAVAAGARYAKSFKNKTVNDTMDSHNKVEDAFKY